MASRELVRERTITLQRIPALWLSSNASRRKIIHVTVAFLIVLPLPLYFLRPLLPLRSLKFHPTSDVHQRRSDSVRRDGDNKTTTKINILSTVSIPEASGFGRTISHEQDLQLLLQNHHSNKVRLGKAWKFRSTKPAAVKISDALSQISFATLLKAIELYKTLHLNDHNLLTHSSIDGPDFTKENIHWSCVMKCMGTDRAYVLFLKCCDACKDWIVYDRTKFFQYLVVCIAQLSLFCVCSLILIALVSLIATMILEALQFIWKILLQRNSH